MNDRTLPCGCRLDGRYVCPVHYRESVTRFVAGEIATLAALALFLGMIGVWAAILS
ncbi:MAG: hypothetical protein Q7S17_00775 [Xanthobacteraceae bacterium]|nr:hypothetical protein [Xanthobacteraceae bacterium]